MEIAAKKLIIALDDLDLDRALEIVSLTKPFATTFKVGLSLFFAYGPKIVHEISSLGVDVFLDLKLHDIPMQVKKAVKSVLDLRPRFLTLHALGGRAMLEGVAEMAHGSHTTLLAVSVLTSLDQQDYRELGFLGAIENGVMSLTELAFSSGVRGFISSPHEVARLRARYLNDCFLVCPGIRLPGDEHHDQSRVLSPKRAILAGADALVVGRSITKAADVVVAAQSIYQEIEDALQQNTSSQCVVLQ